ncbi:ATP-binding protein [Telmatospirillum siberiense]|uniref:histidine kinase n=1 Tax=Telmatospirillum siberiense TaxID=382514 RepID=A0A2N3PYJ4_9PROT|nr:ATP-binding protein [Telmatospirillum siberiense]PKU25482.1 diguanylate cyclase [Telmatospirillum siberiense]
MPTQKKISKFTTLLIAIGIPVTALALQWILWPWLQPFVWFLFFPAVFFSARFSGLIGGLISTFISVNFVWYFFIPPQFSWEITNLNNVASIFLFIVMGCLFSSSQERLRHTGQKLSSALKEAQTANQRINDLYERTLELDHMKTEFFSNISHELRTPLTLILGPVETILKETDLSPDNRRHLEVIERNARFLYRHISDLLDVAKVEADRMPMRYVSLDLAHLTRVMASHFESVTGKRKIRYEIHAPERLDIQADDEKLERILLNLLSNAFKFVPDGGEVDVFLGYRDEHQVVLKISDNGPGIPPDSRETIFERFRQLDSGLDRRHGGTGLGLSIVKEFVELHGGNITCSETPGGGATFNVTLPIAAPAGAVVADGSDEYFRDPAIGQQILNELRIEGMSGRHDAESTPESGSGPLVLVVEDNPDMNAYIAEALNRQFRIATAYDGEEGLHKALNLRPDLILTDLMMPKMSGDRMVEELRRHPSMSTVPIVVLTAKTDEEQQVKLLAAGVQEYIGKPFSLEELRARLANLVQSGREIERTRLELAAIVEYSDDAIIGKDLNGIITSWNRGAEKLFGYRQDEMVGKAIVVLFPEGRAEEETRIMALIVQGMNVEHFETIRRHKDGHNIDISVTISPIKNRQGLVIGASKIARDISQRKAAEREIKQLNADLERRVEERTRELRTANHELDAFAYAVSHDLRAPLRAMSGFSQALAEDYGEQLTAEARLFLDEIGLASKKMGNLLEGILALSRVTRNEPRYETTDLSIMAEQIRGELALTAPHRHVVWDIQPGVMADGDPRMLQAVMDNLLGNAWKYTALKSPAHIRFFTEEVTGGIRYCVSDDGAGFDMAHADRLFQPFQRLHRQDEFPGLGIGLATVQRIIHRHGGIIVATAARDQGATFAFTLGGKLRHEAEKDR